MAEAPDPPLEVSPAAGTPGLEDAWETHRHTHSLVDRYAEYEACQQLDRLRLEPMQRDAVVPLRLGGEPTRREPRESFWSQAQLGRS
jgi:hypothetical protein